MVGLNNSSQPYDSPTKKTPEEDKDTPKTRASGPNPPLSNI